MLAQEDREHSNGTVAVDKVARQVFAAQEPPDAGSLVSTRGWVTTYFAGRLLQYWPPAAGQETEKEPPGPPGEQHGAVSLLPGRSVVCTVLSHDTSPVLVSLGI